MINLHNTKLRKKFKFSRETKTLFLLTAIYIIATSIYTTLKHYTFKTKAWDLGIFAQALWTTIHDEKFFYETPDLWISPSGSFFGVHFSPIMFLLLAIYYAAPSPYTLLVLQSILFGLAAVPAYYLAKEIIKNDAKALLFPILYIVYPATIGSNLYDFHLEAFFPIIIFTALYYMEKKDWSKFYLTLIINLTILDFASLLLTASLLFYAIYIQNYKKILRLEPMDKKTLKFITISTVISATILITYYWTATTTINYFGKKPMSENSNWQYLGNSLTEIITGMLYPNKVLTSLTFDATTKILWIILLLIPLGFLPLYSKEKILLPAPIIWLFLLSTYPPYYQLGYQYGAIYEALIIYTAIHGYKNTQTEKTWTPWKIPNKLKQLVEKANMLYRKMNTVKLYKALLIATLLVYTVGIATQYQNNVFIGPSYQDPIPIPNEHTKALQEALKMIPENATVLAQNNIFPHLAHRTNIYAWIPIENLTKIDYAIADTTNPEYYSKYPGANITFNEIFKKLYQLGYKEIYNEDGVIVLIRGP